MKKSICSITMLVLLCITGSSLSAQVEGKKKNPAYKRDRPPLNDVKSKEIATEFPCNGDATVFLENILRRVTIRTTNENKVRLVTTVYYQGDPAYTDADWFEKLQLSISGNAGNVVVKSGNLRSPGAKVAIPSMSSTPRKQAPDTLIADGIAVFDSSGNWVNRKSDIRRNVILYIPAGVKLDIESKYSDISLENNIKEIKVRVTNGGFAMADAQNLTVIGMYGNVHAGNIDNAEVEMTNGRFNAKNITTLDINSKHSTVDLDMVKQMKIVSNADQYEIEEVGVVNGTKNYGDFRVTLLKTSFNLTGINADIRIRSVDPGITLVKIDDTYADIRLPVGALKNYALDFEGAGTNVYTPFEKPQNTDGTFKATVGTGKPATFQLKCKNCTVDFK